MPFPRKCNIFSIGFRTSRVWETRHSLCSSVSTYSTLRQTKMPHYLVIAVDSPCLAPFVRSISWKVFQFSGIRSAWLQLPVHQKQNIMWQKHLGRDLMLLMIVLRDTSSLFIDNATATQDSIFREDILLVGYSHHEVFQNLRKVRRYMCSPDWFELLTS